MDQLIALYDQLVLFHGKLCLLRSDRLRFSLCSLSACILSSRMHAFTLVDGFPQHLRLDLSAGELPLSNIQKQIAHGLLRDLVIQFADRKDARGRDNNR